MTNQAISSKNEKAVHNTFDKQYEMHLDSTLLLIEQVLHQNIVS